MRMYDGRIGKFLSVDPLTKTFPWYTPYQFSGNSPIAKTDLDGGEPLDFKSKWKYQPLFDLKTGVKVKGTGTEIFVTDTKLGEGLRDVSLVYDEVTKQNWFVHQSGNKNYYLKNADGKNSVMTIDPKTYQVKGGEFVEFETQDQIQSRLGVELANNLEKAVFGAVLIGASLPALGGAGATGTFTGKGFASSGYNALSQLTMNGGDASKVNISEVAASFFIQGGSFKTLFAKNAVGNVFEWNGSDGYNGLGSGKFNYSQALLKTAVGTFLDFGFDKLKSLPVGNKAQIGRWQNLSYKSDYADLLKSSQRNAAINSFFNSGAGIFGTGTLNGTITNAIGGGDDKKN
jgi:hypothetical protein